MPILALVAGLWAVAILAVFIWAIRISYAIERKRGITGWHGLPRNTNLLASAFGSRPSDDAETLRMRRKLRQLLALIATGFAILAVAVFFAIPATSASV